MSSSRESSRIPSLGTLLTPLQAFIPFQTLLWIFDSCSLRPLSHWRMLFSLLLYATCENYRFSWIPSMCPSKSTLHPSLSYCVLEAAHYQWYQSAPLPPAFCFGGHCEEWEMSEMIIIPSLLQCHPVMLQWAVTMFPSSPRFLLGSPLQQLSGFH